MNGGAPDSAGDRFAGSALYHYTCNLFAMITSYTGLIREDSSARPGCEVLSSIDRVLRAASRLFELRVRFADGDGIRLYALLSDVIAFLAATDPTRELRVRIDDCPDVYLPPAMIHPVVFLLVELQSHSAARAARVRHPLIALDAHLTDTHLIIRHADNGDPSPVDSAWTGPAQRALVDAMRRQIDAELTCSLTPPPDTDPSSPTHNVHTIAIHWPPSRLWLPPDPIAT